MGPSGALLWQTVNDVGLHREAIYVTNVVSCFIRPTEKKKRYPDAVEHCKTDLFDRLRAHGVKYILALGNEALEALTGNRSITKNQGMIFTAAGMRVIACLHPAAILRQGSYAAGSLKRFQDVIKQWALGCRTDPKRAIFEDYEVIEDVPRAVEFFTKDMKGVQAAVVDIETSGHDLDDDEILCATISCGPANATILTDFVLEHPEVIDAWRRRRLQVTWIGHNLIYDLPRLRWKYGLSLKPGFDTILAHYTFCEERGTHGLKQLAVEELNAPDWEADIRKHLKKPASDSYAWLPRPILYRYAAQDGIYTYMLYELYRNRLNRLENSDLYRLFYDLLTPALELCIDMQCNGMYVNTAKLQEMRVKAAATEQGTETELAQFAKEHGFEGILNPRSFKQVAKILYDILGAPTWSNSDTGLAQQLAASGSQEERTTCKAQLERLTHQVDLPLVQQFTNTLLEYREAKHLRTHYLEHFVPNADGRMHPQFSLFASVTGRLASTQPNVMNMSHTNGIRGVPAPEPGNVLLTVDYSQHELRVAAELSGDETLKEIYRSGQDIHDTVATWFYGPDYTKMQRVIAKGFVFGLLFGRGATSIAQTFGISIEEAREKMRVINNLMPTFDAWREEQLQKAIQQGYVTTITGRRRRFPVITADNLHEVKRYAVNAPIQATASDIQIMAMIRINKWIGDYGGLILMPLHDSGTYEVPQENLNEVTYLISREMLATPPEVLGSDCIPFAVDAEWGYSLDEDTLKPVVLHE